MESVYNILMEGEMDLPLVNVVWESLWRLNLPYKVKNFMWRALRNILQTKLSLVIKRVDNACGC